LEVDHHLSPSAARAGALTDSAYAGTNPWRTSVTPEYTFAFTPPVDALTWRDVVPKYNALDITTFPVAVILFALNVEFGKMRLSAI
jgi:hypothetical protein